MQFLEFLSLLQKRGLSFGIYGISFPFSINVDYHMHFLEFLSPSQKMWTIICNLWNFFPKTWTMISNLWNFFPFSKNVDYHKKFLKFLSFLPKRGLLYAIFGISFPSQKMWTIICIFWNLFPKTWTMISNLWNFFPFSRNMDYHMQFLKFRSLLQNVDYYMQFLEFISLLKKRGLLYAI